MKTLIIGSDFYNYREIIGHELEDRGYLITIFNQIPSHYFAKTKVFGCEYMNKVKQSRLNQMLLNFTDYDLVLVLVGEHLLPQHLLLLRDNNRNARFVLYLWDDVDRVKNFRSVFSCYDAVFTFSHLDAMKYKLNFLPLFYNQESIPSSNYNKSIDIYSAMGNHSDRVPIAERVIEQADRLGLRYDIYIQISLIDYYKKKKSFSNIKYIWKPIPMSMNINNISSSKSVLDIQFESQIGLTMRTIETLGYGTKLITTNSYVSEYDFYNPQNILIINRQNPVINKEFFLSEYETPENEVLNKYTLSSWVDVLLGKKRYSYIRTNHNF